MPFLTGGRVFNRNLAPFLTVKGMKMSSSHERQYQQIQCATIYPLLIKTKISENDCFLRGT